MVLLIMVLVMLLETPTRRCAAQQKNKRLERMKNAGKKLWSSTKWAQPYYLAAATEFRAKLLQTENYATLRLFMYVCACVMKTLPCRYTWRLFIKKQGKL